MDHRLDAARQAIMRPASLDGHCPRMTPVVFSPRRGAARVDLDVRVRFEYFGAPAVPAAHAQPVPRSRDVVVIPAASYFAGGHAVVSNHVVPLFPSRSISASTRCQGCLGYRVKHRR